MERLTICMEKHKNHIELQIKKTKYLTIIFCIAKIVLLSSKVCKSLIIYVKELAFLMDHDSDHTIEHVHDFFFAELFKIFPRVLYRKYR